MTVENQENTQPLSKTQLWGLGLSAILTEMNRDRHDVLDGGGDKQEALDTIRHILKRDWGIETREALLRQIHRLLNGHGHGPGYRRLQHLLSAMSEAEMEAYIQRHQHDEEHHSELLIVRLNRFALDRTGIDAWDEGRSVNLCRWGMAVGMVGEKEGWDMIMSMARDAQQKYDSWYHFAISYVVGRQYWRSLATEDFVNDQMDILRRLTGNPESPWNTLDWHLPLDGVTTLIF